MFARDVTRAASVAKPSDQPRRAFIQCAAIGPFFRQSLFDVTPDHLGEREAALASLGPQSPRLWLGELNLCSDHPKKCKHIMM